MDWLGTSTEAREAVDLALVKVESTVPVTDPSYGGAVVLNPGGPGGSGVGQVLRGGHDIRTILSAYSGTKGPDAKVGVLKRCSKKSIEPIRHSSRTRTLTSTTEL